MYALSNYVKNPKTTVFCIMEEQEIIKQLISAVDDNKILL